MLPGQIPQQQFFTKARLDPFRQIPYPLLPGALGGAVCLGYDGVCRYIQQMAEQRVETAGAVQLIKGGFSAVVRVVSRISR